MTEFSGVPAYNPSKNANPARTVRQRGSGRHTLPVDSLFHLHPIRQIVEPTDLSSGEAEAHLEIAVGIDEALDGPAPRRGPSVQCFFIK